METALAIIFLLIAVVILLIVVLIAMTHALNDKSSVAEDELRSWTKRWLKENCLEGERLAEIYERDLRGLSQRKEKKE